MTDAAANAAVLATEVADHAERGAEKVLHQVHIALQGAPIGSCRSITAARLSET
jgi:hypothetical protein